MELIQENEQVMSSYDPTTQVVYIRHKGIFKANLLEDGMRIVMEFVKNNPVVAVFQNFKQMTGTFTKSIGFVKGEFVPHMENHGMKYVTHVMNSDVFTKFALNQFFKLAKLKHDGKIVSSPEEGKLWLEGKLGFVIEGPEQYMES